MRDVYLRKLQGALPAEEIEERRALLDFVSARPGACAIAACLAALERRDVDALAWPRTLPQAEELAAALRERGFVLSAVGDHVLAVRPPHAAVRAAVAATPDAPGNDR